MRVGIGFAVAFVVSLSACAGGSATGSSTSAAPTTATPMSTSTTSVDGTIAAVTTIRIDSADPRPIATLGFLAYGIPFWTNPTDLQTIYVYPDGNVIFVRLDQQDAAPYRLIAMDWTVDRAAVERIVVALERAGVVGDGAAPLVTLPPGYQVQDGGSATLTLRISDDIAARTIDQPGTASGGERDAVDAAVAALVALLPDGAWSGDPITDTVPLDRWVVFDDPAPVDAVESASDVWTGPSLETLDWHQLDDTRCAIVAVADWPITEAERYDNFVTNGRVITRRPLLPHEASCSDLVAWRRLLADAADTPT